MTDRYTPRPEHKFSFGLWTVSNRGMDPFGAAVRPPLPPVEAAKLLGEVDFPHALTLRTSIIGHELAGHHSLICWFLAQEGSVRGFSKAVFSGLPTVEIARIIDEYVLPRPELSGLYHLSADPIDKYRLLQLVAEAYGKTIRIDEDPALAIDRSLDGASFLDRESGLWLEEGEPVPDRRVRRTPRVGVGYAGAWATRKLRFVLRSDASDRGATGRRGTRRARPRRA